MPKLNSYLNFGGNCFEAFTFYKRAFGGEFGMVSRAGDGSMEFPEDEKDLIMHINLPIGNDILMGSDVFASFGQEIKPGNNQYVSVSAESKEEADHLFAALSEGGKVNMPISEQFFGYYGEFTDKFGINWMVSMTKF